MKRHTRSSRRSTEDVMVTSFGKGERSTRSRTASDELIVPELPKSTRSRKYSSTDKKSELSKDNIGKRRNLSSSSKHRTRSQSGSDLWVVEPSFSSPKGCSKSNASQTSVTKDGTQGQTEKVKTDINMSLSDIQLSKRSSKTTTEKIRPKETPKTNDNSDGIILKASTSLLLEAKRTRHNSGNNVTLKHSNRDEKQNQVVAETRENDSLQSTIPIEAKISEKCPSVVPKLVVGGHLPVKHPIVVSDDSNSDSISPRTEHTDTCSNSSAPSNEPQSQFHSGNVAVKDGMSLVRRASPKKVTPEEETEDVPPSVTKSLNPLATSMQADSKDNIEETSKRKLSIEVDSGNSKPEDAPSEQRRKRHRSSSRNLTTEFDNSLNSPPVTTLVDGSAANSGKQITTQQNKKIKELSQEGNLVTDVPTRDNKLMSKTKGQQTSDTLSNVSQSVSVAVPLREMLTSEKETDNEKALLSSSRPEHLTPSSSQEVPITCREAKQSGLLATSNETLHTEITSGRIDSTPTCHKKSNSTDLLVKATLEEASSSSLSNDRHLAGPSMESSLDKQHLKPNRENFNLEVTVMESKVKQLKQQHSGSDVGYEASNWSQEVNEGEPFFFESDHLALKGNKDYRMLLRTLTTLEAQRKQATHDLECLVNRQKQAFSDPIGFVNKIQHNVDLGLPISQRVVPLPEVSWETYLGKPENSELLLTVANQKIKTRPSNSASLTNHHNCLCCKKGGSQSCQKLDDHVTAVTASSSSSSSSSAPPSSSGVCHHILGANSTKIKLDPKSETFNLPWTTEEQRKLEDLLGKYPMESVEARRWEKIAQALGNRTPLQVASRVQKYFIKLTRAGLPVPGRLPHSIHIAGSKKTRRTFPFMRQMPSTFLQSVLPPVYMNDNDGWDCMDVDWYLDDDPSDDESISLDLRDSEEYKELRRLKQMKKDKLRQQAQMTHSGFQCDGCGIEPIVGTRWHCGHCPSSTSTDLCQKCMDKDDYKSIVHSGSHHLEPIRFKMEATYVDNDYIRFQQQLGPYNYLDPNYSPEIQPTL